ncbi:MAG: SAM-dependent methyltransferase [Flavobacteriales bacterium]|nr:SAM-dependent methyltransferase [Flavobacteriales bacterium]
MSLTREIEPVLYLLPVWLGEAGGTDLMPPRNIAIAEETALFFCEKERTARRMLRRMSKIIDLNAIELHVLDKDSDAATISSYVKMLATRTGAIISEAGMPCIADPGARLVAAAHRGGIRVEPLTGPTSLLLALAGSGMNGQRFTFHGYLPRESALRKQEIKKLEQEAKRTGGAQLFIETPYRNDAMLADLVSTCEGGTLLCIAIDLEQPGGSLKTRTITAWRDTTTQLGKRPCVFILGIAAR